jgi:hypothetical protein
MRLVKILFRKRIEITWSKINTSILSLLARVLGVV